jgi:hypothetical protein
MMRATSCSAWTRAITVYSSSAHQPSPSDVGEALPVALVAMRRRAAMNRTTEPLGVQDDLEREQARQDQIEILERMTGRYREQLGLNPHVDVALDTRD